MALIMRIANIQKNKQRRISYSMKYKTLSEEMTKPLILPVLELLFFQTFYAKKESHALYDHPNETLNNYSSL